MLKVSLNDSIVEVPVNTSLKDALPGWNKGQIRFVVAVNREFVRKENYADGILQDGDEVDLVRPVSGG